MSPLSAITTLPIKRKLMFIMMATSCTAIILMAFLIVINQAINSQRAIQQQLITLADVLGSSSTGALSFDDRSRGKEILNELRSKSNIIYAVIKRYSGEEFADFGKSHSSFECELLQETDSSSPVWGNLFSNEIHVNRDIYLENDQIGKICILSTLDDLQADLLHYVVLVAIISSVCFAFTFLICSRLQKVVSEPILKLQMTMNSVAENKDYSLRVENKEENEFGALVDGFNHMLQQVQIRDIQLAEYSIHLEKTIKTRTLQLSNANQKRILWLETMARFLRHELKNSSVGIKTSLDLIERRSTENHTIDIYLERARKSMFNMNALLQSAGDASDLEAALDKEGHRQLDLSVLVMEQLETYSSIYPGVSFNANCQNGIIVPGNEIRLNQLLDKLISNAVEHTDKSTAIEVVVQQYDDKAHLIVKNKGDVLPIDKKAMFELFVSLRSPERQNNDNFGLGLYIVKLIAESHGGHVIAYDLKEEAGAVFEVILPIVDVETKK